MTKVTGTTAPAAEPDAPPPLPTREQILDPAYAANRFYDALVRIEGYEDMRITEIAQRVQRSAYPEAYADHEWEGRVYASNLTGHTEGGLGCRLKDPDGPGDASRLSAALSEELGVRGTATGRDVTVAAASRRQAWAVGTWAVVVLSPMLGVVAAVLAVLTIVVGVVMSKMGLGSYTYGKGDTATDSPSVGIK